MKKRYTVSRLTMMVAGLSLVISCNNEPSKRKTSIDHDSVHIAGTETAIDDELSRLLKPVNRQVIASIPVIQAEEGTRITNVRVQGIVGYDSRRQVAVSSRTSGRIERLYIKYNFQPVKKGQLIMELYSPDLAAAQREYLFILRSAPKKELLEKARQRLLLLGMTASQVRQVATSGNIIYRVPVYSSASGYILERSATPAQPTSINASAPAGDAMGGMNEGLSSTTPSIANSQGSGVNSPVLIREGQYVNAGQSLFVIYKDENLVAEFSFRPEIAKDIRKGQRMLFNATSQPEKMFTGTIGLVQPVFNAGQNFTIARVYFKEKDLLPGQLLTANIPLVREGYWLPRSAVLDLGTRAVVFRKSGGTFIPIEVRSGLRTEEVVQVTEDIGDWQVAVNAAFLVDSESFIRAGNNKINNPSID